MPQCFRQMAGGAGRGVRTAAVLAALVGGVAGCDPCSNPTLPTLLDRDHVISKGDPTVTVFEYADLECPVCGAFHAEVYPTIKQEYLDTDMVRWVFRHMPISASHPHAQAAAEAAECAADQIDFFDYTDVLFADQDSLDDESLSAHASELGADQTEFEMCLMNRDKRERVDSDFQSGLDACVSGTPTFFVNGQMVRGYRTVEEFREILDTALADAAP